MTIARRLLVLMAVPLVAMGALGLFTRVQLAEVEARSRFVGESRIKALATLGTLSRSFAELRVNLRTYLLTRDPAQRGEAQTAFDEDEKVVARALRTYANELAVGGQDRRLLEEFDSLSRAWIREARRAMALEREGRHDEAVGLVTGEMYVVGRDLSKVSSEWIAFDRAAAEAAGRESIQVIEKLQRRMLAANLAALVCTALLGWLTFRSIVTPIRALETSVRTIAAGEYGNQVPFVGAADETGGLARSIDVLKGGAAAMDEQRWVKSHVSEVAGALQGAASVHDFGRRLLSPLVPLLGGGVAAFYVRDTQADGDLYRVATFGLADGVTEGQRVRPGEGLVGECARQMRVVQITDLPAGYLRVSSGVGSATPARATAFPAHSGDTLFGVLEVGSFRQFTHAERALLDELLPLVAMSLDVLQRNLRTAELLQQTREQAAQLEAQALELVAARTKAEEATAMKSMFLANMSHEIRTPMNAVIGLSYLALKTPLTPRQQDYISKIHNAGTSLLAVINDILDFSKIEAGRLDLEETEFRLDEVIASATVVTAQKAHDKGLEFLVRSDPGVPDPLVGDPLRLGQVLTNCLNNAIKFTEHGHVRLDVATLERTGQKVQIRFSVSDTGIGMTPEQASRLFRPFTQADMSTTRKHGGTGLGLTISRRLVEQMGGRIWFDTSPTSGTTFHFTVWLGVGEGAARARTLPDQVARLRVLVVDDNDDAREILREPLSTLTARVDVASTGQDALAAIRAYDASDPYDVVFMDWRMPGMDGLQASREIKSDNRIRHRPAIVLVTAFGREEVRDEADRMQLDGFLMKPVTRSMIVDTLVNVISAGGGETVIAAPGETLDRVDGAKILLAEDNEINQQIAVELLTSAGATVTVAVNGAEAVRRLVEPDAAEYDLVLMDLQMPEMDGFEATARIRADARFRSLPIIAMTAHATLEERQRCLDAGMSDHVGKPIDPRTLIDTIRRHYLAPSSLPGRASAPNAADVTPLPVIDGLDSAAGLGRVGGNRALYLRLLRQFADEERSAMSRIAGAEGRHDRATAERAAHTLKGVAANIGATAVAGAAAALEKAFRSDGPAEAIASARQQLAARLEPLLASLTVALEASSPPPGPDEGVPAPLEAGVAERLLSLLADSDPEAADLAEAHAPALKAALGAAWPSFEQQVRRYAFDDAHRLLSRALTASPSGDSEDRRPSGAQA